ncbi:MAG: hypothetical protein DHS20C21_02430 [Gemmatimonadota bacterium]|nr:MAG: hypothetical protein DHS20C21_02430 [Gemmatimonadota bacterium]
MPFFVRFPALVALLVMVAAAPALALRVATYNILNYSSGRTAAFRTVLTELQPDVLMVQEILSQSGVNNFRTDVLDVVNPGEWSAATFVNGTDTDNALYFRHALVDTAGHTVISTALRDIDEWTIRPASHTSAGAEMRLYVVHLKASSGSANVAKRLAEVTLMRNRMETFPAGGSYLVAGDFNIYTHTESPFQYMINVANGAAGVVQDPISRVGNWHNNPTYADIHTQSPRVTQFGGGANGGMDDRFDMILVSPADQDDEGIDVIESTYDALGQDGQHYNGALNVAPFTVVTQTVAQALHDASDHLPVVVEYQMPASLLMVASLDIGTAIVGGTLEADLAIENITPGLADELDYSFAVPAGFTAPGGTFELDAGVGPALHAIGLDTSSFGPQFGSLTVNTDDPDHPADGVTLTGTVLNHAQPSVDEDSILLLASLDLGTVLPGDTLTVAAQAHNFDYDAFAALMDVHSAQVTGDVRFFLPSFSPATIGGTPGSWDISFDAVGAADGVYNGSLAFSVRDQQDLPGATALDDLVFDLTATVGSPAVGVDPILATVFRTGLESLAPNPFRSGTAIRFGMASAGLVDLRLFDVSGREVDVLARGSYGAGEHTVDWYGRSGSGAELAPGIYFVRLQAGTTVETRKLVRIR